MLYNAAFEGVTCVMGVRYLNDMGVIFNNPLPPPLSELATPTPFASHVSPLEESLV